MRVHPWMFWLCIIVLLSWIVWLHLPLLSTMSTGYFHSPHLPVCSCWFYIVLLCIIELYWLVLLTCIIVIAYTPQSTVSTGFTLLLTHMSACVRTSLAGRTIYFVLLLCIISCVIAYWHWHLLLPIRLLPQLLRAVAPALTLIISFKLRHVWCLPPIVYWLHDDCDVASVALPLFLFPVFKFFSHLLFYLAF